MQDALLKITSQSLTNAQSQLAQLTNGLTTPVDVVKTQIRGFLGSLNTLLNIGFLHTDDVLKEVNDEVAGVVKRVTNTLIKTGNRIESRHRKILGRIYNKTLNGLDQANRQTNLQIQTGTNCILKLLGRIHSIISKVIGRVFPPIETCTTKLSSLGMASATTGMESLTADTTTIIKNLNDLLDAQFNTFSGNLNTSATTLTVSGAEISANLLKKIADLDDTVPDNTPGFDDCLGVNTELVSYIPIMISDNLAICMNKAIDDANATDTTMDQNSKALETSSRAVVTNICNCVASITSSSNMVLRASASTCASKAVKLLDSAPIQAEATEIADQQEAALVTITDTFNSCIGDITSQLPALETYVQSEIQACAP